MAEMLAVLFGKVAAYQPLHRDLPPEMHRLKQQGFLEIRTPGNDDDHALKAVIKDYQNWAQLHGGRFGLQASLLKALDPKVPFFEDSAPGRILADLKSAIHSQSGQSVEDPLFRARLFLHFAQEYDRRTLEIETDLSRHEERAQNLIDELKAEEDVRGDELNKKAFNQPSAPDDYMLPGRLSAWTRMLLHDPEISGLFVTPSLSVFEFVKNFSAGADVILHTDRIPAMTDPNPESRKWQHAFLTHLTALCENNSAATIQTLRDLFARQRISEAAALTVCRIAGPTPHEFFVHAADLKTAVPDIELPTPGIKNMIIILVFSKKKR